MYYSQIVEKDMANGKGVRTTLFVSGCRHHCPGCFNEEAWSFTYGQEFGKATINTILVSLDFPYVDGLTLLGGEPFEPENQIALLPLVQRVKELYPDKTIWCYTGYTYEEIIENNWKDLLEYIDVLVDGEFRIKQKDLTLPFRGSSNQRIIDVQKSLKEHRLVDFCLT